MGHRQDHRVGAGAVGLVTHGTYLLHPIVGKCSPIVGNVPVTRRNPLATSWAVGLKVDPTGV